METTEKHEKRVEAGSGKIRFQRLVMQKATGVVYYHVDTKCPYCGKELNLNQFPYDDDQEEYGPAEDELGLALFGRSNEPAKWSGFEIEYKCYGCKERFLLAEIEI